MSAPATPDTNKDANPKEAWKKSILKSGTIFTDMFGVSYAWSLGASGFIVLVLLLSTWGIVRMAPKKNIVIATGPSESSFMKGFGRKYLDEIDPEVAVTPKDSSGKPSMVRTHVNGISVELLESQGSQNNLELLRNPDSKADVGFVLSKVALLSAPPVSKGDPESERKAAMWKEKMASDESKNANLVSLGCIAYQPVFIFYRADAPVGLLSAFAGKHISIGASDSGTNDLATTLLEASGITTKTATLSTEPSADAAQALQEGKTDVVFLMGESAPTETLRTLLRAPGIRLFSFEQADSITRKFTGLNKLILPEGGIDLAKNIPAKDVVLLGPNIQLFAKKTFNPALSDLVLDAAVKIHRAPTLLQLKGEFPNATEHGVKVSDSAIRYYKSGKTFFYSHFPFWLATLLDQFIVVVVPTLISLGLGLKSLYSAYKFQIQFRLNRWYRIVHKIERERFNGMSNEKKDMLISELTFVERKVRRMKVPGSFVSQFYGLCGHIDYVRSILEHHSDSTEVVA